MKKVRFFFVVCLSFRVACLTHFPFIKKHFTFMLQICHICVSIIIWLYTILGGNGLKQVHLIVSGHVQGVGFRYYAQMKALDHHITGWVRNRKDGSVEIIAEGEEQNITNYLKYIQDGSPFSTVQSVKVIEQDDTCNFDSFKIKY